MHSLLTDMDLLLYLINTRPTMQPVLATKRLYSMQMMFMMVISVV